MAVKILLTDDEADMLELLRSRFAVNNWEVITAQDGRECIEKIMTAAPDLVILDIVMPKLDGYNVLNEIKNLEEENENIKQIPIIILTASTGAQVEEFVKDERICSCIRKPFDTEELLNMINECLERKAVSA
ncbi:response regulator [Elusimicrobiota bacterium]